MSKIESNAIRKSVSEPALSELPHKDGVLELERSNSAIDVMYNAFEAGLGKTYQGKYILQHVCVCARAPQWSSCLIVFYPVSLFNSITTSFHLYYHLFFFTSLQLLLAVCSTRTCTRGYMYV